ncbi:MAG: peptide chain release factor N(5)-glutamine methyltransferase [Brevinema sp.]
MNNTVNELWDYGKKQLPLARFPERDEELTRIFLDLLGIPRHELSLYRNAPIPQQDRFYQIINERQTQKPLAYILGYSYFYGEKFPVSEETLIPRYDTEVLVDAVKQYYKPQQHLKILDIGTGTGAIALSLAKIFPNAFIKGIDLVEQPFRNSQRALKLEEDRIKFERIDFLKQNLQSETWDCIVSNPPYLDGYDMEQLEDQVKNFEPHTALYAEQGGLHFYQRIAEFARDFLAPTGVIFLEVDHKYQKVCDLFSDYQQPLLIQDLSGLIRVLRLEKTTVSGIVL